MMSKPKYIVILTGLFCSIVAGVLRTFTRFFRIFWQGLIFWFDNYDLWPWQAKPRPKNIFMLNSTEHGILIAHKYKEIHHFLDSYKQRMLFFMLINVKMPTIVGILKFMRRRNLMFS